MQIISILSSKDECNHIKLYFDCFNYMKWSETEDWQEYQSKEYKFKIKYPSELQHFQYDGKRTIGFEAQGWNVIVFCEPYQNHKTLDDLTKQYLSNISKDRLTSLK